VTLPMLRLDVVRDGRKDVKDVIQHLATGGRAYVDLYPSGVIAALSERRQTPLLRVIGNTQEAKSRADAAPKVGDAALSGNGLDKALRYYAYRYIEELWKSVSQGGWGTAAAVTQLRKYAKKRAIIGAWGVAQRGAAAWYNVLKGRSKGADPHDQAADGRMGVEAKIDVVIGRGGG